MHENQRRARSDRARELVELAAAHYREGAVERCLELAREAARLAPEAEDVVLYHSIVAAAAGEAGEAISAALRAVDLDAEDPESWLALGWAYGIGGEHGSAASAYQHAIELGCVKNAALCELGNELVQLGRLEEGVSKAKAALLALEADSEDADDVRERVTRTAKLLLDVAASRLDQERDGEALAAARLSIELVPNDAAILMEFASIAGQAGDSASARDALLRAAEIDPSGADIFYNLGIVCRRAGLLDEAVDHYHHALRLQPTLVEAWNNLGLTLNDLGRFGESEAALRRGIEFDAWDADLRFNLGVALNGQNEFEAALAEYQRAMEYDPADPAVHRALVRVLARLGRHVEAEQSAATAAELERKEENPPAGL